MTWRWWNKGAATMTRWKIRGGRRGAAAAAMAFHASGVGAALERSWASTGSRHPRRHHAAGHAAQPVESRKHYHSFSTAAAAAAAAAAANRSRGRRRRLPAVAPAPPALLLLSRTTTRRPRSSSSSCGSFSPLTLLHGTVRERDAAAAWRRLRRWRAEPHHGVVGSR